MGPRRAVLGIQVATQVATRVDTQADTRVDTQLGSMGDGCGGARSSRSRA